MAEGWEPHAPPGTYSTRAQLGRYHLIESVGVGGMGEVFSAYDPELDRRVALKVVETHGLADEDRQRLVREARALARLSHPHVVAVHDIGRGGSRIFIAMELVQGRTLRAWLTERRRTVPEILAVFRQAGAGLAAAHSAGLVHRDFKPDNVLVGFDGSVRVVDFGLAQMIGAHSDRSGAEVTLDAPSTSLTAHGSLLGTPPYMAPEQWLGDPVTPLTDQFAYCTTLYEALYDERPFAGELWHELRESIVASRLRRPRPSVRVPPRLRRAVLQGLSGDPHDRHASMAILLNALEPSWLTRAKRWLASRL